MNVCTDLQQILARALRQRDEDVEFRTFIAQLPDLDEQLDNTVNMLTHEAMAQVDCIACHNCCVVLTAQATAAEVVGMCGWLGVTENQFAQRYIVDSPMANPVLRKHEPSAGQGGACALSCNGRCTVYGVRPADCRAYPLLLGTDFRTRLWSIVDNCHVCPIVSAVYEELKLVLRP